MNKTYIGIDNGVTGSIAILNENITEFIKTPVFLTYDYTKKKQKLNRLDCNKFYLLMYEKLIVNPFVFIERPMVNPTRYKATLSAIRCMEATLICLETLKFPYEFCDSKEWQKVMLNNPGKSDDTKQISRDIGIRLFPGKKDLIIKHGDADSLLMAEYARRCNL
jgi:hypothetical protein